MAVNDDYLGCKSYTGHEADPKNSGFTLFQDKKSGKHHFAYVGVSGEVLLRSEGYVDVSSRTKGIASIKKNIGTADRFAVLEEGGKFYIILKAGNNKEIGRSCDFKSKSAAEKALAAFGVDTAETATKKEATPKKEAAPKKAKTETKPEVSDNLLSGLSLFLEVSQYLDKPRIWDSYGITGYVKFQSEEGKHFFGVYNPDATLYLRSQGFATEEERDAAFDLMDSIILLEENYKVESINGRYYAILFEESDVVAISPDFGSFIEAFVTTPGGRPREIQGTMF
jgi:uncharacterized protein YegP (UPF0339 family)